jgi:hypothetical protein
VWESGDVAPPLFIFIFIAYNNILRYNDERIFKNFRLDIIILVIITYITMIIVI